MANIRATVARRWFPVNFRVLTASLLTASLLMSSGALTADTDTGGIAAILSNLPARSSAAYSELFNAAGRPRGEALDMTKAEMWGVPAQNWGTFSAAAARLGVIVTKLDGTWNHALVPMSAGQSMTVDQQSMMHDAMASKAAVGMSMMALPEASVEEYALTNGMHDTTPASQQPTLIIPLTDSVSVSARRTSIAKTDGGYAWHGSVDDTGEPVTLLWWPSGKMTGTVTYKGRIYSIHNMGASMHGIEALVG